MCSGEPGYSLAVRHRSIFRQYRFLGLHAEWDLCEDRPERVLDAIDQAFRGASHCVDHSSFDLHCRDTEDGPSVLLATLQNRLRDIVALARPPLVAWLGLIRLPRSS